MKERFVNESLKTCLDKKSLYTFLFISFVLSWAIIIPFDFFVWSIGKHVDILMLISHGLGMLAPGLGCIYIKKYVRKESVPKLNFNYKHTWIYIIIIGVCAIEWLSPLVAGYWYGEVNTVALNIDSTLSIAALLLLGSLGAYGEELGWRGFLLPELRCIGIKKATILHGVIWGVWHFSLLISMFLFVIVHANPQENLINNPALQASVMQMFVVPIGCILVSIIPAFLQLRYNSLFMVSLLHASDNFFRDISPKLFEIKNAQIDAVGKSSTLSIVNSMEILMFILVIIVPIPIFFFCKEFKEPRVIQAGK